MFQALWKRLVESFSSSSRIEDRSDNGIEQLLDYLSKSVPDRQQAVPLYKEIAKFQSLSVDEQRQRLANFYLFAENYLVKHQGDITLNAQNLREVIENRFPTLFSSFPLKLINSDREEQGFYIIQSFVLLQLDKLSSILGQVEDGYLPLVHDWLTDISFPKKEPISFPTAKDQWSDQGGWIDVLSALNDRLIQLTERHLGDGRTEQLIAQTYDTIAQRFRNLDGFGELLRVIPIHYLDQEKIDFLNNNQMRVLLLEKLAELEETNNMLQAKNQELEAAQETILKRNENIREAYEFNQQILDTVGEGILSINEENVIVRANQEVIRIFGYQNINELLGQSVKILIPKAHQKGHLEAMRMRRENPGLPFRILGKWMELEGVKKTGEVFPAEVNITRTVQNEVGQVFTAAIKDISDRKHYERALQDTNEHLEGLVQERTRKLARTNSELMRSNQELEQFAYIASHDLQEPLRTITSFIQLLRKNLDQSGLDPTSADYLSFIESGGRRMRDIINDLLVYSRVGRKEIERQPVAMERLVNSVVKMLDARIRAAKARVQIDPLPLIEGDATLIAQLFQNLIDNAIKFCKARPLVEIRAERLEEYWVISVTDNGIGIKPEFQTQIFEIFQRLHARDEFEGTGIGLAVCKRIMDKHRGRIEVASEYGEGATFKLWFPFANDLESAEEKRYDARVQASIDVASGPGRDSAHK